MQNITKTNYGKCDTANMMVELKKRGYVVLEEKKYHQLIKKLNKG